MNADDLTGIWKLGLRDIHRESDWFYRACNHLVENINTLLTNKAVSIRRNPRTLGFNTYSYNLAGDLAQCLRYARAEADMAPEYLTEVVHSFSSILGNNVFDLIQNGVENLEPGALPHAFFDWTQMSDRPLTQILWAAEARQLLEASKPIPDYKALALTGWPKEELSTFSEGDVKMTTKRIKNVVHYNPEALDLLLRGIEERFFDYKTYIPL